MVTQSIPLVADLRTQNRNIGTIYLATGLVTEGDTGGGIYFWNPSSTNADDGFYYLQVTGVATGRWVRIYAGSNIYNTDGSLLDNRDVTLSGSYLKFIGTSANSTFNADGSVTLSSLSGVNTRMVVANNAGTLGTQSFVPGTTIRFVEKFTATLGQTVFNTTNTLYNDLFDVFLNGVKLNTDSFSFTANQITLADGAYADDIIDVVGFSSATVYAALPSQTGNAGKYLSTNGTNLSWESVNLTGYVPYTGATTNVDLGEFELKAGQLTLDVSPTGTASVGTTRWNNTIGSSETTLKGGSVLLKNGVDLVARVVNKVFPNATLTKAAYQAVRVSGAQGQRLAVAYAQANNDNNSADTIGLVTETIATNQEGFIITVGSLEDINTTGSLQGETWVDGDVLYLSPTTPGAITNVKPVAPQHIIVIGYVEYAHANNGKIYVKTMNGWELGELHDVSTVGATNGQVLAYNGSIWAPATNASGNIYTIDGTLTGNRTVTMGSYALLFEKDLYVNGLTVGKGGGNQSSNVALGTDALYTNSGGFNNSAIGYKSLRSNTIGYANSAFGYYSLYSNISTYGNSAFGNYSLYSNVGFGNTAVGDESLIFSSTGSNNTAIGYNAGGTYSANANTTGSNNIFIGYQSIGESATASNRTFIGNASTTSTWLGGNLLLGTRANSIYIIDAVGNARIVGNLTATSLIKSGGTSSQYLMADGSTSTLTNPVTGTGAAGQVAYWNGTSSQTGSNNLFWDAANARLGIGKSSPVVSIDAVGAMNLRNTTTGGGTGYGLEFATNSNLPRVDFVVNSVYVGQFSCNATDVIFKNLTSSGAISFLINNATTALKIFSTGNLVLQNGGTFTDSGQRLQVYGDAFIKGSGATSATNALLVQNSAGTNLFSVDNSGLSRFGAQLLTFSGDTNPFRIIHRLDIADGIRFDSIGNTVITTGSRNTFRILENFAPTSGTATLITQALNPTINQTGGANGITRGLYVTPTLTAAADWRSIEWSNNSGWGLYGAGTANNYLGGALGIGTTNPTFSLDVAGSVRIQNNQFQIVNTASTVYGYFFTAPNAPGYTSSMSFSQPNSDIVIYNGNADGGGGIGRYGTNQGEFRIFSNGQFNNTIANLTFYTLGSERARITTSGRLLLGTTTEGTQLLQVQGTAYFSDNVGIGAVPDNFTNLLVNKNITGGTQCWGIISRGQIQNGVTATVRYFASNPSTVASTFSLNNLFHYSATQGTFGAGSTVNLQVGYDVDGSLINGIVNIGFRGEIAEGSNRWNLYMSGTANNYFNGDTSIGTTTLGTATKLTIGGSETASSAIARGGLLNTTLVAAANNDVLVGLDINPTFTNGAFTGVSNYGIRSQISLNNIYDGLQIRNTSTGASNQIRIKFDNENTVTSSSGGVIFYTGNSYSVFPANSFGFWNHTLNGIVAIATNNTERLRLTAAGRLLLGTTTEGTFLLDVNGTARVSGVSMLLTGSNGAGNDVKSSVVNTNGAGSANIACFNNTSNFIDSGIYGTTMTGTFANVSYANQAKIQTSATNFILSTTGGDKPIIFAVNATSTTGEVARFTSASLTFSDGINIILNATTGTKIGTATSQKLSFWNATPIVQPTTAVAAATFVTNTSLIANDSATFDGYTIGQIVKALRNAGLLA